MADNRANIIDAFLGEAGWLSAEREALKMDASTRSYMRLTRNGISAILMNAPPASEASACPPDATAEKRQKLGYNALARLAGPNLNAFTELSKMLRSAGLHAPEIYHADAETGLALIEDLGDNLYAAYLLNSDSEYEIYKVAIEVLAHLHLSSLQLPDSSDYSVLEYDSVAMEAELDLLTEWYWPYLRGEAITRKLQVSYRCVWQDVLRGLSVPSTFVLRDFHAENLLWLGDQEGIDRVGVIDFQDGLLGQPAYDLVSLLEDARRDVSADLAVELKRLYVAIMESQSESFDMDTFETDYAILAAQRNAKILGIFARLINRDKKEKYKEFIPRVANHFRKDLERPPLESVRYWAEEHFPELVSS